MHTNISNPGLLHLEQMLYSLSHYGEAHISNM